ncbi:putative Phosphate starvation-inducible protein psiF precursor [Herminiimonas arsenicoxydans]|uniref:Phosphate starvation-inducible protein psiF n=1 Tax=Herminiimonas arsenicoxydans TaxID=204773 RepID=A4G1N8_HERAR|nr:putative Phosphate starvation-inducible protein psiF precursor [Herminiimonas arsenicoxydans]
MNKLLALIVSSVFATCAFAADPAAPAAGAGKTAQQTKMTTCNKEATGKKGDERKAFMKECLSGEPKVSPAQQAQRDKMKACNAEASAMKGEERKKFMKTCLSKK